MDDPILIEPTEAASATVTEDNPPKKSARKVGGGSKSEAKPESDKNESRLGDLAAAQKAVLEQSSVATCTVFQVALSCIVENDNYRDEPSNLARLGYKLVDKNDPEHSLLDMCLSPDIDTVRAVVSLFDEHESGEMGNEEDPKNANRSTSIVSLASKFDQVGQLQAVCVRPVDSGTKRSLIFGQRRVAAAAYRHAKSRIEVADEVEGAKVVPAVVKAVVAKVTDYEAWRMAVAENSDRKDDDPIQEGMVYARFMKMIDPDTGKRYTLNKTAALMGVNKGHVRGRAALTEPRDEKKGRGLTDEDREAIRNGTKTVTWGIRRALGEKHYSDGNRQTNRAKPIPLKAIQKLFDDTDETNTERLKALAECMGFANTPEGLADAVKQSEDRIAEQESKKPRGKRKKTIEDETDGLNVEIEEDADSGDE